VTTRQHAVVTGAAGGIGRAITQRLARSGLVVHACDVVDCRHPAGVSLDGRVHTYRCDVGDSAQVGAMVHTVAARLNAEDAELRVVVNNAGVNVAGGLLGTSDEDWDRVLRTNLYGTFYVTRALIPLLVRPGGVVVSVASDQASKPKVGKLAYGVSKAAIAHLARQVALEHAPDIRSVAVSPGPVDTDMLRRSSTAPDPATIPLGRIATADEVAKLVEFLTTDAAGYITGVNLAVDGGLAAT
jgi:NAD(P)-dependent dehydrogenase (short-subunit alcohol dehydrogenase family)